ncbi:restriction endonuclease subunit S [Lacticaseibacillus kribbianus]|uniref:restriction endonuclease subunit S n=1 Tax=Lacticaseibacillus kribbianus TaxID=2926292 RepID=UPI001CD80AEE|nr:restriction endonuclease subunit S [Lacticaseibacillus kribbianus]
MGNKEEKLQPRMRFRGFTDAWEKRPIKKIASVNGGKDYKHLNKGDIPVYGTGGYMLSVDQALSQEDGIGIGRKGTINSPYILRAPYWTVDTLFYVIPKGTQDINFLYAIFQRVNWKKYDESTGVPSLSKQTINAVEVTTPTQAEQELIGTMFKQLDNLIAVNQRRTDNLQKLKKALLQRMFVSGDNGIPAVRFTGFTDVWEKRKLGTQYKKVIEKNDLSFSTDKIISVANMYFKADESKSDESYMKTYNVFRKGDIAFEGNKSKNFSYGRFVENDIGDGIISHVFDVFRPTVEFDLNYWKYAIHYEPIMGRLLMRSTTKATMMNSLVSKDFLKQELAIPNLEEQVKIGTFFAHFDNLIAVNQRKVELLKKLKQSYLQKMFV